MNNKLCRLLLASFLLLTFPLSASALCVGCSCTAAATAVAFGSYDPFGAAVNATGNVRVTCSALLNLGTINYTIALDKGTYSAGFDPRQMGSGANRLNYNLYTSNSYGTIWGDGSPGTATVDGAITLLILLSSVSADHPVYGQIPGSQTTTQVGSYSDTIFVTVTYN